MQQVNRLIQVLHEYYMKAMASYDEEYAPGYGYLLDMIEALKGHGEYLSTLYYHCPYFADLPSVLDMTPELVIQVAHYICDIIEKGGEVREEY